MRKIISRLILLLFLFAVLYGVRYAWRAFPIISGYGAKNLCSCVFVAGREPQSVIAQELGKFPLNLANFDINDQDSVVTASVWGLADKKAIYRRGTGCTLISGMTESEVRKQTIVVPHFKPSASDTVLRYDTALSAQWEEQIRQVVSHAFQDTDPDKHKNTRAVVVIQNGKLLYEQYAPDFDKHTPQMGWSMTKSITNALIGILIKDGKLSLYQPAPIEEWQAEGDARSTVTIDQLLRMSSGLAWEEEYGGPSTATNMLFKEADMGSYASGFPLAHPPDTKWYYSSGTSNILSMIIRNSTGADYYQFVYKRLLHKIGMSSAVIEPDASGTYVGSSYLYATPLDWAKFGMLYLNDGVWNGERILPEGWVRYSSTATPGAPQGEYGAHFWLNAGAPGTPETRWYPDAPTSVYSMNGFEGQRVFIIPSKNAVVVRMGLSKRADFDFNEFLSGVISVLPEP